MIQLQTIPLTAPLDPGFSKAFKAEIESLPPHQLPLQKGLQHSSVVGDDPIGTVVLNITEHETTIETKAGIFYSGVIAGCNCSDDPTPPNTQPEYCELLFVIERSSGKAEVSLL